MVYFKKKMMVTHVVIMFMLVVVLVGQSVSADVGTKKESPKVLVVFSSLKGEFDEHQRMLAMLIGHFTEHHRFRSSKELSPEDLQDIDYLFYYGQQRELLSESAIELMSHFSGTMVAIGHNVEQFGERFSFVIQKSETAVIDRIAATHQPDKQFSFIPQYIINIELANHNAEILLTGTKNNLEYPLLVKHHRHFYFASPLVRFPFSIALAEGLHEIFSEESAVHGEHHQHYAYLRLEDVHPFVEPDKLMAIAKILHEKEIPYMISVIPVYTNPETGRQYHFSDSPKLLKVLKYMQDHGGSIILHGYTHQFRLSETGEGFEFWDVEYNMPIYHHPDATVMVKTRNDFSSDQEYEQYQQQQKAFEKRYIEERIVKGIEELVNYGLYPLAFEAPHYTMSQNGYLVLAHFFSTYSGQVQISDEDWEIMATAPYISKPSFLHGMLLLPETMGYVQPEEPQAIQQMVEQAKKYQFVRDGMLAGFYHPYLGTELFTELIGELDKLEVEWIDLKQLKNTVRTENVEITSENGQVIVEKKRIGFYKDSPHFLAYQVKVWFERISWGFALIGMIAVILFTMNILRTRHRNKQMDWSDQVG